MRGIRLGVGYDRSSSSHLVSHLSFFRNSARLHNIYIPLLSSHPSCASILTDIHHDNSYRRYHPRQEAPHRSSRLWPNGPTTRCQCTYCQLNLPHLELTLLVHFLTLLNTYALTKQQLFGLKAPQAHHSSRSRRRRRSFPHRCQMG